MIQENYNYLKGKYYHWETLRDGGYLKDISQAERKRFHDIIRAEFVPDAIYCLTCPDSVAELVRILFIHFDKYLDAERQKSSIQPASPPSDTLPAAPVDKVKKPTQGKRK